MGILNAGLRQSIGTAQPPGTLCGQHARPGSLKATGDGFCFLPLLAPERVRRKGDNWNRMKICRQQLFVVDIYCYFCPS